jgi:hypothetical protein
MFKVFNRGQKVQLNDIPTNATKSNTPTSNTPSSNSSTSTRPRSPNTLSHIDRMYQLEPGSSLSLSSKNNLSSIRRQSGMRHSLMIDSRHMNSAGPRSTLSSTASMKLAPHEKFKKYVSCENVHQASNSFVVITDEDEFDENGLKDKFKKRYNSLTNLLMRSFRKAKYKKKKDAMFHEPTLEETNCEEYSTGASVFHQNSQESNQTGLFNRKF